MSAKRLQFGSHLLTRVAGVALLAGLAAGCSGTMERFGEPIYTGGTANQRSILGGSQSQPSYDEIAGNGPVSAPQRQRQAAVTSNALPPVSSAPARAPQSSAPLYTASIPNGQRVSQPAQPPMPGPIATSARVSRGSDYKGWTATGGTVVTLGHGETLDLVARRYGVPADAIASVNGIDDPSRLRPGSQIVIPTYVYNGSNNRSTAPRTAEAPKVRAEPVRVASTSNAVPSAKPGHVSSRTKPQRVASVSQPVSRLVASDVKPKSKPAQAKRSTPRASVARLEERPSSSKPEVKREVAPSAPITTASVRAEDTPAQVVDDGNNRFRWPVRGRIISSFGSKPGGTRNDGVNLAVPEGTAVRAVESGTVIYSGNELKGYGNLVLIRHEDGWVSAYAHNSSLDVKRGDTVRRGDVVAKAGSTGTVNQPQLHFELRRGNKPVDPMLYLPKNS
ncbi:peptidoglycan DD-metalloendopeptidase family protein [Breoghania sp.]|uniref:peptidoglycan DD-metalloendopeptidase family protein n=1 Tax=Breoghania sp. TaxID=2065378 RepID=UPI002AAA75A3|nr:peptidoglycan DD-metalloendopeptidase family protein [Breoghania sp.]